MIYYRKTLFGSGPKLTAVQGKALAIKLAIPLTTNPNHPFVSSLSSLVIPVSNLAISDFVAKDSELNVSTAKRALSTGTASAQKALCTLQKLWWS
jgi:hypothetical protein